MSSLISDVIHSRCEVQGEKINSKSQQTNKKKNANLTRRVYTLKLTSRNLYNVFFKWAHRGLSFVYFRSFQTQILQKTMFPDVSGIRTRIVRVEGNHADLLTTTTANKSVHCYICLIKTLTKAYLLKHISERSGDNN